MQAGDKAWLAMLGNVCAWEVVAPEDELFTDAFTRFRIKHPGIALAVTVAFVAHMWQLTPRYLDPISGLGWIASHARA